MRFPIRLLPLAAPLVLLQPALAEDEAEVRYVPLLPAFVTNFGVSDDGNLRFLKADVSVRVSSQAAEMAARYHLPALRNAIVLLLSRQEEASVSSGVGREAIRAEALAELRSFLEEEEGNPFIEDVMFTNFILQRSGSARAPLQRARAARAPRGAA